MNADQELHDALEQGWRTTPSPASIGFPKNMVEIDPSKGTSYRRCLIRNLAELKTFKEVTDPV